ncbi:unnamed protein product [Zymoseptoria tritici ST99CH_3D7]|uniref:Uncharacterized protein n=1 Tax=Zymoseptoria tritici (strain ST99CH_3D7) TaxID=1276538 RepID=A0A1X7RPQ9_ZYMT9|nr:unnamed protein product [Zymoseptoria tritici ST99CH_3D7]
MRIAPILLRQAVHYFEIQSITTSLHRRGTKSIHLYRGSRHTLKNLSGFNKSIHSNAQNAMSYKVYRVAYAGMPRDHHAINVEQNDDESGWLFQVTGDIQNGMSHDDKAAKKTDEPAS